MLRADWQKGRLQRVEADLFRTVLAESPGNSLAAVLLAESPAAKLLVRVQRQIAAFERCWHRANTELRRARAQAESAPEGSFDKYLDFLCAKPAPGELASLRQDAHSHFPAPTTGPTSPGDRPPTDEKTGPPSYFVG
jgi:hypothetical protein